MERTYVNEELDNHYSEPPEVDHYRLPVISGLLVYEFFLEERFYGPCNHRLSKYKKVTILILKNQPRIVPWLPLSPLYCV